MEYEKPKKEILKLDNNIGTLDIILASVTPNSSAVEGDG